VSFFSVKEKERVCLNFYPRKLNILQGVEGKKGCDIKGENSSYNSKLL